MYFNIQHRNLHVNEIRGYGTADIGRKNPKAIESLSLMSRQKVCTKTTTRRDIKVNLNICNHT